MQCSQLAMSALERWQPVRLGCSTQLGSLARTSVHQGCWMAQDTLEQMTQDQLGCWMVPSMPEPMAQSLWSRLVPTR